MGLFGGSKPRPARGHSPPEAAVYSYNLAPLTASYRGRPILFPPNVLTLIFAYICPHTGDQTFTTCDESLGDGCMICQTYDLSQCALVSRQWRAVAIPMLYHSVRLDAVHFCGWEDMNDARSTRKKKSKQDRKRKDAGTADGRLRLFAQTVRDNRRLAQLVCILKIAYMTRESCKADLARAVAVMPNLRYVDVPDGVFADASSCMALKLELENSCMDLRKTKFLAGSERTFLAMAERRLWRNLEAIEVEGVDVEADALLYTLASFATLREVKLANMLILDDELLTPNPSFSLFPAVERLVLENAPGVTAAGLCSLFSRPTLKQNLMSLTLKDTGVLPQELHPVLGAATHLVELSIADTVERPFPLAPIPPLASSTLEVLFFGILPAHTNTNVPVSESYYTYIASSLLANSMPALSSLFAYSSTLPRSLHTALLPTPEPPGPESHRHGASPGETRASAAGGGGGAGDYFLRPPAPRGMRNITARLSTYSISSYYQSGSPNASRPTTSHGPPVLNLDLYTKPPSQPEVEWSLTQLRSTGPPTPAVTPGVGTGPGGSGLAAIAGSPTIPSPEPPSGTTPAGAASSPTGYTPQHFSTPNVRASAQHGASGSLGSNNLSSVGNSRAGSQVPTGSSGMIKGADDTSSGIPANNPTSLAQLRQQQPFASSSNISLPLPSHTISSTRPLSSIFAEQKRRQQQERQQQQPKPNPNLKHAPPPPSKKTPIQPSRGEMQRQQQDRLQQQQQYTSPLQHEHEEYEEQKNSERVLPLRPGQAQGPGHGGGPNTQPQPQQQQQQQQRDISAYPPVRTSSRRMHPSFSLPSVRAPALPGSTGGGGVATTNAGPPSVDGPSIPPGYVPGLVPGSGPGPLSPSVPPLAPPPHPTSIPLPPSPFTPPSTTRPRLNEVNIQPIDAYAIGRIGSGRVLSGRVASGINFGGYLGQGNASAESLTVNHHHHNQDRRDGGGRTPGEASGGVGGGLGLGGYNTGGGRGYSAIGGYGGYAVSGGYDDRGGHDHEDERNPSAASWRTKRKGGVIGDWMG